MWYIILKVGCALCLFEAFSVCGTVCLEWFSYAEVTDTSVERVFNCTGLSGHPARVTQSTIVHPFSLLLASH